MTIRLRLTLWYAAILLFSLLIMGAVLHHEWTEQQHRMRVEKREPESAWGEVGEIIVFYGVPTALLLLGGGWLLLRKSLAPITTLTLAAERMHLDTLRERLPRSGNGDELDRLTEVLNAMMARLNHSFSHIREFTVNASHELKTPLTVMRAEMETALTDQFLTSHHREIFGNQLDEIVRLTKIVDALTFLAKNDAGQGSLNLDNIPLHELVRDSFADAQVLAESRDIEVTLPQCDEAIVHGDRHRLRQLLLNLTDNAIKYNHQRGSVTLTLRANNGSALFSISNTGSGINPEVLPRVFDRFFRGDLSHNSATEGCGLGLSIVQSIVKGHGGDIKIDSAPNQLTTVIVTLPLSDLMSKGNCAVVNATVTST